MYKVFSQNLPLTRVLALREMGVIFLIVLATLLSLASAAPVVGSADVHNNVSLQTTDDIPPTPLTIDQPMSGTAAGGSSVYYSVGFANPTKNLRIILTPKDYGDPDLYGSLVNVNPKDEDTRVHSYNGQGLRFTVAEIADKTIAYARVHCSSVVPCDFNIIATFGEAITLQDGIPQNGVIIKDTQQHYVFTVVQEESATAGVFVDLTATQEYANAYISTVRFFFLD